MEIEKLDKQKVKSRDKIRVGRTKNEEKRGQGETDKNEASRRAVLCDSIGDDDLRRVEKKNCTDYLEYGWTGLGAVTCRAEQNRERALIVQRCPLEIP